MLSKKLALPIVVGLVALGGIVTTGHAYAQTPTNPFSQLVQMIAQKFNLDQNQVQSVVDQYKQQHQQNRQQMGQDRMQIMLDKLVTQGKINKDQEQAIINEINALKAKYPMTSGMTKQQLMQNRQNMQNDFSNWKKSQGITVPLPFGGFGEFGMRFHKNISPTPTQ